MREMGIARQSLYGTFGDKRALYLKALAATGMKAGYDAPLIQFGPNSEYADATRIRRTGSF